MCHRWWLKGERVPSLARQGYQWTYIFSAIRPVTGEDFTLVLPLVNAAAMNLFLAQFAATLPADAHAVLVLDGAGWHDKRALNVPENPTLVPLPAYSPELNPVEQVWLYRRAHPRRDARSGDVHQRRCGRDLQREAAQGQRHAAGATVSA